MSENLANNALPTYGDDEMTYLVEKRPSLPIRIIKNRTVQVIAIGAVASLVLTKVIDIVVNRGTDASDDNDSDSSDD